MEPVKQSESTASLFANYSTEKFRVTGKLGTRRELVNQICFELGIADHYRSGIYFQANGVLTDSELRNLADKALAFKANPAALFRKLLKEKRKQIKETLQ